MTEYWRLFIAIELPPDVIRALADIQADLKRIVPAHAAKWVRSDAIHLTLKYLGDVPIDDLDTLKLALRESVKGHAPFDLALEGLGCFPNTQRPRVLWVGVAGDTARLRGLQADVEEHTRALNYPEDERAFSPHLTLARAGRSASRDDIVALGLAAEKRDTGYGPTWQVEAVSLMRSVLTPDGAQYSQAAQVPLEP